MSTRVIVAGMINTDIIAVGVDKFAAPGAPAYGGELKIGPGGKSRNIAQMIAVLINEKNSVAMLGRTAEDSLGIWKVPVDALNKVGVNTSKIKIVPLGETNKAPAVAMLAVTKQGTNAAYILSGISDDFSIQDIEDANELFEETSKNDGILAMTLECHLPTAKHAISKATKLGIKVVLDSGGIEAHDNADSVINEDIFLIKPNEHEAKILTGVTITDLNSANMAAHKFFEKGIKNVLITVGSSGAYLFTPKMSKYISIPKIALEGQSDDTGCGDQTMAALCTYILEGKDLDEAAELAILAGTLEYHKVGISPVTKQEIESYKV